MAGEMTTEAPKVPPDVVEAARLLETLARADGKSIPRLALEVLEEAGERPLETLDLERSRCTVRPEDSFAAYFRASTRRDRLENGLIVALVGLSLVSVAIVDGASRFMWLLLAGGAAIGFLGIARIAFLILAIRDSRWRSQISVLMSLSPGPNDKSGDDSHGPRRAP